MANINSIDYLFYHEKMPIDDLIQSEVMQVVAQPKRVLFYSRSQNASGMHEFESNPNGLALSIFVPYDVTISLAKRNALVSDGTQDGRDLRAIASQDSVKLIREGGELNVQVDYIQTKDQTTARVQYALGAE